MKPRKRRETKHAKKLERLRRRGKLGPDNTIPGRGKNRARRHQGASEDPHEEKDPSSEPSGFRQP